MGAFSPLGTFRGVCSYLDYLVDLGVTAIELMPVADFPGKRNWGYDGVLLFAPDSCYGRPEDLKVLVQTAHQKGLTVFLDVVYNHFGPEGNFGPELAASVSQGRRMEFAKFTAFREPAAREHIPDPNDLETFKSAILDWDCLDQPVHREWLCFYKRLLHHL